MKNIVSSILFCLASLMLLSPTFASGTATASLGVSVTVDGSCTVSTQPLAFPVYNPINVADTTGTGSLSLTCTQGTSATIALGGGLNNSGSNHLANGANLLSYKLYQDVGLGSPWSDTIGQIVTASPAPNTSPRTFTVYGKIPSLQNTPGGVYSDTVVVTVNY